MLILFGDIYHEVYVVNMQISTEVTDCKTGGQLAFFKCGSESCWFAFSGNDSEFVERQVVFVEFKCDPRICA
jgi:hypothetical protein